MLLGLEQVARVIQTHRGEVQPLARGDVLRAEQLCGACVMMSCGVGCVMSRGGMGGGRDRPAAAVRRWHVGAPRS